MAHGVNFWAVQELDLMIFVDPFQLRTLCDSVIVITGPELVLLTWWLAILPSSPAMPHLPFPCLQQGKLWCITALAIWPLSL